MTPIYAVDTETTGLDDQTCDLFEIAVVDIRCAAPWALTPGLQKVWRVQPSTDALLEMHPKAAEVNRYWQRIDEPDWTWDDPQTARDEIRGLLDGAHVVGAVPDFDARFITEWYRRAGETPPRWHYHLIDVETLIVGYIGHALPTLRLELPWNSDDLSRYVGIEPPDDEHRHTALADAIWAARVFTTCVPALARW